MEFLQDRDDLPPQLKDSQWFLDLVFLTDLTGEQDGNMEESAGERYIIPLH
jgi:hypothetical protein